MSELGYPSLANNILSPPKIFLNDGLIRNNSSVTQEGSEEN